MATNRGDYSLNASAYTPIKRVGQNFDLDPLAQVLSQFGSEQFDYTKGAENINLIGADNKGNFAPEAVKPAGFMDGFGMADAIGAGTDILGGLLSYQTMREGKKQNRQANAMSLTNLSNQANLTNASLSDRQARRVANDPNATSVADYMEKFGVSGTV